MDQDVPTVLRAFPRITAVLFVWSPAAYHWFCTQALAHGPWGTSQKGPTRRQHADTAEFPQRSADNAWAVFCPVQSTRASGAKVASGSIARRLLGPAAAEPWILINMTAYGNASLAEWGPEGSPLDFFTTIHLATADKGATLVSLNTPPSVLTQLYGDYGQPPPSIYWLSAGVMELPEFTRTHFASKIDEEAWWHLVIERTAVNLHLLPDSFDPDTQAPPATFWKK